MSADRPAWAQRLRAARRTKLLSQKELAKEITEAADKHLRPHLPTRESLIRKIKGWEAGDHHPRDPYRELLGRVLAIDLDEPPRENVDSVDSRIGLIDALVGHCRWDLAVRERDRHEESQGVAVDEGFFDAVGHIALTPAEGVPIADSPRRIDHQHVAQVETVGMSLRRWDNLYGGGLRRKAVVGQLSDFESLVAGPFVDECVGRRLFAAIADLAQLAGWMSFDLRLDTTAQRYFVLALRFAKESGDRTQMARMLYCLARQTIERDPRGSLDLVQTALYATRRIDRPLVLAMLRSMEARAYARMGAVPECHGCIGMAEAAFSRTDANKEPEWAAFFSAAELAGVSGAAIRDLALSDNGRASVHAEQARPWIAQAAHERPNDYLRSRVLDLDGLAVTDLLLNEPESAATQVSRALDLAMDVHSARVDRNLRRTTQLGMSLYPDVSAIQEVSHRVHTTLGGSETR